MNAATFSILYKFSTQYFTTEIIYTIIYIYDFFNNILLTLPLMFSSAMEAGISGKRIAAFLLMPEVDNGLIERHTEWKSQY